MASTKTIKDESRKKALELLAPNLLEAAEAVGVAASEWADAERIAAEKAEDYRAAWQHALDNSWTAKQLDQLPAVTARPPRKRSTSTPAKPKNTTPGSPPDEQDTTSTDPASETIEPSATNSML